MSPADDGFTPTTGWLKSAESSNSGDCVEVASGHRAPQVDAASDAELTPDQP